MAVLVNFGVIVVNSIGDNSGIFSGENVQQGWDAVAKLNAALTVTGYNDLAVNQVNIVSDPEVIDIITNDLNNNTPLTPQILKCL
jgi:hypothetical protein